jgi:ubiquinone/menaquinone biosynthesis C-methylase UbiE
LFIKSPSAPSSGSKEAVNLAFSKQSSHYDELDNANPILQKMRSQVYEHVSKFIQPQSSILELNAGTGIDALYFARSGYAVLATDLADGMITQIERKIEKHKIQNKLTCRQLSYDQLDLLQGQKFDYVFSNFGGLNCIEDLSKVTRHLPPLLNPGAYITWVIMPPICPWDLMGLMKGNSATALRRLRKNGTLSHLEGEYFKTYYHSLSAVCAAFGKHFKLIKKEGLAALTPPPHRAGFPSTHRKLYALLEKADHLVRRSFPFDRWADHIIVTLKYDDLR